MGWIYITPWGADQGRRNCLFQLWLFDSSSYPGFRMAYCLQSKSYVNHLLVVIWAYVVIVCNKKHDLLFGLLKRPEVHADFLNAPFCDRPAKMGGPSK